MYFSVEDMDYWYEITGEGIPVVLLHGFTGSTTTWNNIIESSPQGIQYITIDLPGHGRTKGNLIKTMDATCSDLYKLIQHLKLGEFYLVGYSMGGRTALTFALKYPEQLQGLVLESASPGLKGDAERKVRKENDATLAERILSNGVEAFIDYWENIPLFHTQKLLSEEQQQAIRNERLSQDAEGLASSLRGMGTGMQASNWEQLADVQIPVHLLVGSLDEKFVEINLRMAELLPNAILEIFEDAGHAIHIEKPADFNAYIVAFANSHTS